MGQKTPFILADEMPKALAWILADKAKNRAEYEAKGDTKDRWYARECYLTASDLEQRVRAAAAERIDGKPYGSNGLNNFSMTPFRFQGLNGLSLLDHCRRFLLRHPKLERHNFGRGHVSGERFRTADMPISESENRTIKAKAEAADKPRHMAKHGSPLCTANRKAKPFSRPRRTTAKLAYEAEKVTCPRCLKLLQEQAAG